MRPPIARDAMAVLSDCGTLLDVHIEAAGEIQKFTPAGRARPRLGWSKPGHALVAIVGRRAGPPRELELTAPEQAAAELHEQWSDDGREGGRVRSLTLPAENGEWRKLGRAHSVGYRSDKFGGTVRDYEHDFGPGVDAYYFEAQTFGILVIKGGSLRHTKDGLRG